MFKIEKQQDNDDDYATPASTSTPLKALPSTTLSAETGLVDLEKQIGQADSFMLEIDEIITEWDSTHIQQYHQNARVPYNKVAYNAPRLKRNGSGENEYTDSARSDEQRRRHDRMRV